MGCYDTITVKFPLPVAGANAMQYQTKDLGRGMDFYVIRKNGTLWRRAFSRKTGDAIGWEKQLYDGPLRFYNSLGLYGTGWIEWKAKFVVNEERPAYMTSMERAGWEPVPAERHPQFMPAGQAKGAIERKGMILMERPKELTDRAKARELRKARGQVQAKEAQLNDAPQGQFERKGGKVSKSYEAIPIPTE